MCFFILVSKKLLIYASLELISLTLFILLILDLIYIVSNSSLENIKVFLLSIKLLSFKYSIKFFMLIILLKILKCILSLLKFIL